MYEEKKKGERVQQAGEGHTDFQPRVDMKTLTAFYVRVSQWKTWGGWSQPKPEKAL